MVSNNPKDTIFYMINNGGNDKAKDKDFIAYTKAFSIDLTAEVLAKIKNDGKESTTISASFFKKPNNYTINIKSKYNSQYSAGGPDGLIDGIFGSENWRKGDWQGYQSQDFECVIDLKKVQNVSEVSANFLQDSRSWILMPTKVEFYTSTDNVNFTLVQTIQNTLDPKETETKIIDFKSTILPTPAQYLKVMAYNYGKLPEWHQGFGGDAFIFVDEIIIK